MQSERCKAKRTLSREDRTRINALETITKEESRRVPAPLQGLTEEEAARQLRGVRPDISGILFAILGQRADAAIIHASVDAAEETSELPVVACLSEQQICNSRPRLAFVLLVFASYAAGCGLVALFVFGCFGSPMKARSLPAKTKALISAL